MISKYSGITSSSDHFPPIFIVQNLLKLPLLDFEVRGDVILANQRSTVPLLTASRFFDFLHLWIRCNILRRAEV